MNLLYHISNFRRGRRYIKEYVPNELIKPEKTLNVSSAWKGLDLIIKPMINKFGIGTDSCIEFGVEFGYSSVVFSNYFKKVVGVDTFVGDIHTKHKGDHFDVTSKILSDFENIQLIKSDYKDWIKIDTNNYNLAHVDIIHTYKDTYDCGLWAAQHSQCTIFHDTESFNEVREAVIDISKALGKKVYNYPKCHGLGIIV